ncbi:MAG: class I SAM-dependent methyltransferase [Planctomycetota bacterium]
MERWKAELGLTYHVPYAVEGCNRVGIEGKDVLEIGGRLPKSFVFEGLKARSWTAIEAPDYMPNLGSDSATAQIGGEEGGIDISVAPDDFSLDPGDYNFFHYAAEDMPSSLDARFDVIFSIACFEHVHDLGRALEAMYRVLKPGGKLFSMFSPIWSSPRGHHIPEMTDEKGRVFTFNQCPIPDWGHLLMRPPELYAHLCGHTDKNTAAKMVYYTYHAPVINRYFTEDYFRFFQDSPFEVEEGLLTFQVPIPDKFNDELKRRYCHSQHFANQGILAVLKKGEF